MQMGEGNQSNGWGSVCGAERGDGVIGIKGLYLTP